MNLFKKFFNKKDHQDESEVGSNIDFAKMSLDEIFVHNFIKKGGKFLYCSHQEDVNKYLSEILNENEWEETVCFDKDLSKIITIVGKNSTEKIITDYPLFSNCEHLISDNGSILFSSNQLQQHKIADLPTNFIVLAKTSQLVRNASEGLMAIRLNYKKEYPTNISSIKGFMPNKVADDFLSYGNTNAKNLYLLLLEDL